MICHRYYVTVTRGQPKNGTNSTSDSLSNLLAASPSAEEGGPKTTPGSGLAHATVLLKATSVDFTPTSLLGEVQEGEQSSSLDYCGWVLMAEPPLSIGLQAGFLFKGRISR